MNIKPGDIVYSKAGRDKDKPFVVVSEENGGFALIADGALRKTDKPKKKKIKHLKTTDKNSELIANKLLSGFKVTNRELKKALSEFINGTDA